MTGGLRRIALGLIVTACFLSPMDALRVGPIGGLTDVLFLVAGGVLVARHLVSGRVVRAGPYLRVMLAAGLLAMAGLFGTVFSTAPATSLVNIARFSMTTIGLTLAVAAIAPRREEVRRLAWSYVLGCTANALVGFTAINPVIGRSSGLSTFPNVLGISAAFALALLFGLADTASRRGRWLCLACGLVLLGGLSRSGSRAAIVALIVSLAVYLLLGHRYRIALYLGAAVLVLGAAIGLGLYVPPPDSALDRVVRHSSSTAESDQARAGLRATVVERIDKHVLTGSGFAFATQGHNVFVQIVDIGGFLGVVAFGALAGSVGRAELRSSREPLVAGALAMYAGYLVSGAVSNALWDRWLWFPVLIGLAAAADATDRARRAAAIDASVPAAS